MVEVNKKAPAARKARTEAGCIVGGSSITQYKGSNSISLLQVPTIEKAHTAQEGGQYE